MKRQEWTSERLELLRELWARGETAAAIGERLGGLTRSAVLGKLFRLRLVAGAAPGAAVMGERYGDQDSSDLSAPPHILVAPKRRRRSPARIDRPQKARPAAQRPKAALAAKARGKSLLELTNHSCRWPYGRPGTKAFFFCGTDEADLERGMPYCPLHAQRAYVGGDANKDPPSLTWSTLHAVFAPEFDKKQHRGAAGGSRA